MLFCNDFWTLHYLRQWGSLGFGLCPHEQGVPRWYVLQNRPGLFAEKPWDRWLAESGQATFVHELDGVPLIWIFPIEEYEKARRKFESGTSSR